MRSRATAKLGGRSSATDAAASSTTIYSGRVFDVRSEIVELPDGRAVSFDVVVHPGAVAIIPMEPEGTVVMVRQYRPAIGREMLELPAGTIKPPEAADACARRELAEEAGLAAARWTRLFSFYPTPGFCTEKLDVFLAEDLSPAHGELDEDEVIEVERVPLRLAHALVRSGDICDSKSVAGLLFLLDYLREQGRDIPIAPDGA